MSKCLTGTVGVNKAKKTEIVMIATSRIRQCAYFIKEILGKITKQPKANSISLKKGLETDLP